MLFFFRISALKILAVGTAMPRYRLGGIKIFCLDLQKNNCHCHLTCYPDRPLALLFTFPVSSHKTRKKVKAPPARGVRKSYIRPSIVIVGNYKMRNNKFVMQRIEVTNFDHRAVFVYVWLGYFGNRRFTPDQISRIIFFHFVLNIRFVIFHCNIQNGYQITYPEIFNSSFGIKNIFLPSKKYKSRFNFVISKK
jgi:hypothetical protein